MFENSNLEKIAKSTGFMTRKRKITAKDFVSTLIFSALTQKERSLLDITNELDCNVSKVAVHKKFTPLAVDFVKGILAELISQSFTSNPLHDLNEMNFSQINIKDSTKVSLPKQFADQYPSFGGFNNAITSLLNIQFEYNLLDNSWKELKFTKVTKNDQSDSRDTVDDIIKGSLNLRDLGYISTTYLQAIESKEAFYLNRLHKINIYQKKGGKFKKIDWCELAKEDKKNGFSKIREMVVYLGQQKLKTRLVINSVPENVKAEKIRKAAKGGKRSKKSKKYNISAEHKAKLGYSLIITNIPKEKMDAQTVIKTYSLRWQIELKFKAWKSNLKIDQIKPVNIYRMECELYCKLIFAFLASHIAGKCNLHLEKNRGSTKKQVSYPKLFKHLRTKVLQMKNAVNKHFTNWIEEYIIPICRKLTIEKKKGKTESFMILEKVYNSLS